MKSNQDIGSTKSKVQFLESQMLIKKQSKTTIYENEIVTHEPITLITLHSNILNYKLGELNKMHQKRENIDSIESRLMTIQQFKNKQLDQKKSISQKIHNDFVKKKQREFTLFIGFSIGFLCCVTLLIIYLQQNYTPEIKSLF